MFSAELKAEASALLDSARTKKLMIATAESCTGGLISALLTEIAGSSDVFERGFVTYSNAAKTRQLGVAAGLIQAFGAVSAPVARAMAEGALRESDAHITVAVTGVAGPGGTIEKPAGLVHLACATRGVDVRSLECRLGDIGRSAVRLATVIEAISLLQAAVDRAPSRP
jgi:nicotinamide-nucleotide amidase